MKIKLRNILYQYSTGSVFSVESEMVLKFIEMHYVDWNNSSDPSWIAYYFACRRKPLAIKKIYSADTVTRAVNKVKQLDLFKDFKKVLRHDFSNK